MQFGLPPHFWYNTPMNTLPRPRPLVIVILDGWGISFQEEGNAIAAAQTPTMKMFASSFPTAAVQAAGMEVGLPWGDVGNSETGHRNIGAGQVQYQVLPLIDKEIGNEDFFHNDVLVKAVEHAQQNQSALHLMGLCSPGGVHAHINHLYALLELAAQQGLRERVYVHMFTDGRDAPPQASLQYLTELEQIIQKTGVGTIASVMGRFYAMDRNQNWDRTQAAYDMLTTGKRINGAPTAKMAIEQSYAQNIFDEMIPPTTITRAGEPIATIKDNDAVIFFNYRPDRARQITRAFGQPGFNSFPVKKFNNLYFATLAQHDPLIPVPAAYFEAKAEYYLSRIISEAKLEQLHIAETEKYAHITYYLNVGNEEPLPGEQRLLIKSSSVTNFAEQPRMAAKEITDHVIEQINSNRYDVYFLNYANADMVGHTGNFEATVEACDFVDGCLERLWQTISKQNGAMVVTADHGNAEEKLNQQTKQVSTDHTSNPVPFHYINNALKRTTPRSEEEVRHIFSSPIGVLADVAPTILEILHLEKHSSMTGVSLLNSLE